MKKEILDKISPDYPWIIRGIAKLLEDDVEAKKLARAADSLETLLARNELLEAVYGAAEKIPQVESLRRGGHQFPELEHAIAAVEAQGD